MVKKSVRRSTPSSIDNGITRVKVGGYKSINSVKEIGISPLTVLAGPNSSGKSSFIQPLLLMKQTIEEGFDPGPLMINGPLIKYTSIDPLFFIDKEGKRVESFKVGLEVDKENRCELTFKKVNGSIYIENAYYEMVWQNHKGNKRIAKIDLNKNTSILELKNATPDYFLDIIKSMKNDNLTFKVERKRCFLGVSVGIKDLPATILNFPEDKYQNVLRNLIYLPGLRGNPERYYPTTAVDSNFDNNYLPGSFDKYVASLITQWQIKDKRKLQKLEEFLIKLGLTNKVRTEKINDTEVSINVGRGLAVESSEMLINIADVGLGVSQTLPVLVALVYAKPSQTVYIEQPEIHLHPRAQYNFADILCEAINRGVKIIIETHSSLIIKGIQTIVAKKRIRQNHVALHWLNKNTLTGETELDSATLDSEGAFGDWPLDFDEVEITAEMNYLEATEDI